MLDQISLYRFVLRSRGPLRSCSWPSVTSRSCGGGDADDTTCPNEGPSSVEHDAGMRYSRLTRSRRAAGQAYPGNLGPQDVTNHHMHPQKLIETAGLSGAVIVLLVCVGGCNSLPGRSPGSRPNVLFIAVDDLRPALGCYGVPVVHSPNIDRLAARGVVFERAYCQQSVCSPSRSSMLTGLRPDTTRIFDNSTHFRTYHPDLITLPQQFRLNGYHSVAMGKVYHSAWDRAYVGRRLDDPPSWSEPAWFPSVVQYYFTPEGERIARELYARSPECKLHEGHDCLHCRQTAVKDLAQVDLADPKYDEWKQHFVMGLVTEAPDVADDVLYDGQVALHAIATLRRLKDQPFFMAVGFIRPHIPSVAPKRYWDLYDPGRIRLADNPFPPHGAPAVGASRRGGL